MNYTYQNIIIFIIFIYAIWKLITYMQELTEGSGCSSSCGSCTIKKADIPKIKTDKLSIKK